MHTPCPHLGLLARAALVTLGLAGGCPAAAAGPEIGRLPVLTSDDPLAEAELRDADALRARGDTAAAEAKLRAFLARRPNDVLAPVARLSLGRILLETSRSEEARALFSLVATHPDAAVAEQGRFYSAIASARLGQHADAIVVLAPMVGRTIEPADTALLLTTLAHAQASEGLRANAVHTLETLLESNAPEADRQKGRETIASIARDSATPADVRRLWDELDRSGFAFRHIAARAARDADAARDVERAREVIEALEEADIPLTDELRAIARRAAQPTDANPNAIGAILSLSGSARKVGERALRGLMLAAGLPPSGPQPPDAAQLVFRDDGADPARASAAVSELVATHHVIAIIGPIDGQAATAAAKRAQELGVPLITLTPAGAPAEGPMLFHYFPTAMAEAAALARAAAHRGARRVAVLHPRTPYGDALRGAFQSAATSLGLSVTTVIAYPADAKSFGGEVAQLAKTELDAVLVADNAERLALIAPALAAAALWSVPPGKAAPAGGRGITLLAPSVAFDPALPRLSGRYLQGALFGVTFDVHATEGGAYAFSERFRQSFGGEPDVFAAFAHDAFRLIRAAVQAGARSRDAVSEALPTTRAAGLAAPAVGFDTARRASRPVRIVRLSDQAFVPEDP